MNTLSLLLLAALASAQNRAAEIDFQNQLDSLRAAQKVQAERAAAIEQTFTAINDGPEVGGQVHDYIKERRISVVYAPLAGGVVVPEKTAPFPRAIAPILARYAAEKTFADMPECSEKQYMIHSWEARAWIELGGDPKALPVIEHLAGYKDVELSGRIQRWLAADAVKRIGDATGTKSIQWLENEARSEEELKKLDEALRRYVKFRQEEREWLLSYKVK